MISRQMPIYLAIFLLLIALSGCTQVQTGEKTGQKDTTNIPGAPTANTPDTQSADNQTVSENQDLIAFEEETCNAAEDADACDTKLEELGIVSKDDCCQIYKRCC